MHTGRFLLLLALIGTALSLLGTSCGHPIRGTPLNVAKISSVQRYHVKINELLSMSGEAAIKSADELDVYDATRRSITSSSTSGGRQRSTAWISIDGENWVNDGSGWQTQPRDFAPQRQALLSSQLLALFANTPGTIGEYDGTRATHYTGSSVHDTAIAPLLLTAAGILPPSYVGGTAPTQNVTIERFDL